MWSRCLLIGADGLWQQPGGRQNVMPEASDVEGKYYTYVHILRMGNCKICMFHQLKAESSTCM